MQPKIIFLGTGGDPAVVGKQRRASGGIILRVEGYQFHIDPGPGALVKAKEYDVNLRENTAVLVSHAHINHSNDLNAVISAMTYNGLDRKGVVIATESAVEGINSKYSLGPVLLDFFRNCVERVITIKEGQKVGIENIEIHSLKTSHSDPTCVGFKFFTPNFVLAYSSDTSYSKELVKLYEKSDILILNTVNVSDKKDKNNLTCDDAEKIISKVKPKLSIITHFGTKLLDSDPLYIAREIQKKSGVQVIAAVDGLEIQPLSYSVKKDQKTLNAYKE